MRPIAPAAALSLLLSGLAGATPMDEAKLQGLDKITARVSTIEAPVGQPVAFGALEITVRACDKRPPEEPPESAAYVEIVERKVNEEPKTVFSGWMFASSPAVSALEHPVYDIWVLDCISASTAESGTSQ
jgi:hypothetical protein